MVRRLVFISLSTFVVGFTAGFLTYVIASTADTPINPEETATTSPPARETSLVVMTYGGCARLGCQSYRLAPSGQYTYYEAGEGSGDTGRYDGFLAPPQVAELSRLLSETDISALVKTRTESQCPAEYDGLAYRLVLTTAAGSQVLDSCVNDIARVPLFLFAKDQFEFFRVIHRQYEE